MGNNVLGTPIVKGLGFNSFGIGTNACSVDIDEENDKILRIRPLRFDEHYTPEDLNAWKIEARGKTFEPGFKTLISPLSLCYKKRVYSKNRIPYPDAPRGLGPERRAQPAEPRHERATCASAGTRRAQLIAGEIKRVHDEYGPASILCELDGHGETKFVHAPHGCQSAHVRPHRLLHAANPPARQLGGLVLGRQAHLGHGSRGAERAA